MNRIALIAIIVTDPQAVEQLNTLLHEYRNYIFGRNGTNYRERSIAIISITMDAPQEIIAALSGKLGMLNGVSAKTVYAKRRSFK